MWYAENISRLISLFPFTTINLIQERSSCVFLFTHTHGLLDSAGINNEEDDNQLTWWS